ncbi:rev protein [Simian immunodeficiency virus]|uniref:Protein Rev n=1 Tax=Simian immunodeficiency virus TaxID=11723 RepID=Q699U7_SIV|nr:rev protein [Simian immunodeficiency virus]
MSGREREDTQEQLLRTLLRIAQQLEAAAPYPLPQGPSRARRRNRNRYRQLQAQRLYVQQRIFETIARRSAETLEQSFGELQITD